MMGKVKTMVFPDPVNAIPIISRPLRTAGRPCICMGVGLLMLREWSKSINGVGNRISIKVLIGGGTSMPSTSIRNFSRIAFDFSSVCSRMKVGAVHLHTRHRGKQKIRTPTDRLTRSSTVYHIEYLSQSQRHPSVRFFPRRFPESSLPLEASCHARFLCVLCGGNLPKRTQNRLPSAFFFSSHIRSNRLPSACGPA